MGTGTNTPTDRHFRPKVAAARGCPGARAGSYRASRPRGQARGAVSHPQASLSPVPWPGLRSLGSERGSEFARHLEGWHVCQGSLGL